MLSVFRAKSCCSKKDTRRAAQRAAAKETDAYWAEDFEDESWQDWEYDESYFEDDGDEWVDDDEVPEELEEAYDEAEEAYATWQGARRKMGELARARGFTPCLP